MPRTPVTILALCLALVAGCATSKVSFQSSPSQPGAEATAKLKLDDNGNTLVQLHARYLAPPEKLVPPKSSYVLWALSPHGRVVQLGQLRIDKNREAGFRGSTPFDRLKLVITAEDVAVPERPSEPYVIATDFIEPERGWLR